MSTILGLTLKERLIALGFTRVSNLDTPKGKIENCPELKDRGVWSQNGDNGTTTTYIRTVDGEMFVAETFERIDLAETMSALCQSLAGYKEIPDLADLANSVFFGDGTHEWSVSIVHLSHRNRDPNWTPK